LTRLAVVALTDGRNTTAWINANLYRAKKLPRLAEITSAKQEQQQDMALRLKTALSAFKSKGKK
jgi:hypothetical protein